MSGIVTAAQRSLGKLSPAPALTHVRPQSADLEGAEKATHAAAYEMPAPPERAAPAFFIKLKERADLSDLREMPRGPERRTAAYERLVETAEKSQAPYVEKLDALVKEGKVKAYDRLHLPNMIAVTPEMGNGDEVMRILRDDGVRSVYRSTTGWLIGPNSSFDGYQGWNLVKRNDDPPGITANQVDPPKEVDWSLEMMNAPAAWKEGADGHGLTYGIIDSGTDFRHESLVGSYRGRNPDGSFTHDHNWIDFHRGIQEPVDYATHGTFVATRATGKVGDVPVGTAPEAKWISAAAGGPDDGTDWPLIKAMQWMLAPTKLDGTGANPALGADVVGLSWSSGHPGQRLLQDAVDHLTDAGIEVVKSAGNRGPDPMSITSPGQYEVVHTVGSIDEERKIGLGSSVGPSPLPGRKGEPPLLKPNFAAPGVRVVGAVPGGGYRLGSGTSYAQPAAAGAIMGVLSKYPQLTNQELQLALSRASHDLGPQGPDPEFGYGVIDMRKALDEAEKILKDR